MPQVTLSLQPGRISAMIDRNVCETDQIVLSPETEVAYRDTTREFTHIEWRSIAEVIQYLGALVRNHDLPERGAQATTYSAFRATLEEFQWFIAAPGITWDLRRQLTKVCKRSRC